MRSLPAFASAHSHAFQRALRGRAQRPVPGRADDFWGWRQAMYELAAGLTPESLHRIARLAFRELRAAGVLTVGEFHYLHHQPDGRPYDDRTVMSDALIRAAKDEDMRIALLRCIYGRAGVGSAPEGVQRRFCDASLDEGLRDVDVLLAKYGGDPDVRIGIAPHSVRAVPPEWLGPIHGFALARGLPVHMHVAEQPKEVQECVAETGRRPLELVADSGLLSDRFVAVHAIHITPDEAAEIGAARAMVCACPTTERDLGDGLPDLGALVRNRVRLCFGVDGYPMSDPFEEMRGLLLGERLRTGRRFGDFALTADELWAASSDQGARALGFPDAGGTLTLREDAIALEGVGDEHRIDALVFAGSPALVERVVRTYERASPDESR
ncbi:MAG TPA: formimidoylglutamate deiminase [Polyangiaceae bacterium]|jgi:formiminoglutamate deiminase